MKRSRQTSRWVRITLATVALLSVAAPTAHACSLVPPWMYRKSTRLEFMGTALADTVLAGAGARTFTEGPGHFAPRRALAVRPVPRSFYGQLVRVDRLGERARRALPAGVREVLLVPWDYGPDCRTVPWNRSARWVTDTRSVLFAAELRPREHWAGGVPTFDITPFMQPYTDASPDSSVRDGLPQSRVRAERLLRFFVELWALGAALDSMPAPDWDARVRADTSLAGKWPLTEFMRDIR